MSNSKKRLVLVGNAPIDNDISSIVDGFDFVVRINRMSNMPNSGTKTDMLFIRFCKDYLERINEYGTEKYICLCKNINLILSNVDDNGILKFKEKYEKNNVNIFSKHLTDLKFTTTIRILYYLLNNKDITDKYDIYVVGIDINNRHEIFKKGDEWKNTSFKETSLIEEFYLKNRILFNQIKQIII